jgi:hypothetical protein
MSRVYTKLRFICQMRPPGCKEWYVIPESMLTDPRKESDWIRLRELRINVHADAQRMAGVATSARELNELLEKIVGKLQAVPPYAVAKRLEMEAAPAPPLRRSIHFDEISGEETKDPAKLYGPTAAQPLN